MYKRNQQKKYVWRFYFLSGLLFLVLLGLVWRIIQLGVIDRDFLLKESASRSVRIVEIPAYRGKILDRNGEVLAMSAPVDSTWINPKVFNATPQQWQALAKALDMSVGDIKKKITPDSKREFIYLKRHITASVSDQIKSFKIPGVFLQQEYQRYYPDAEIMGQIIGFTNVDDKGQEGLELAYENWLRGIPGKMKVLKDRFGNVVSNLDVINKPQQGHDLTLSIDRRIQYIAYQELKNTVTKYKAETGTAVVLSVKTGEILAMLSLPSCDPNNRKGMNANCLKNKAVTDLFEPGSTAKSFTIANALQSGKYTKDTLVDTNPGYLKIQNHTIYDADHHKYGILTVTGVLQKSSDIGVAKITANLPPNSLLDMLKSVGFGLSTQSGFPGEAAGVLPPYLRGRPLVTATVAFGYGISVTALQLARAYAVIASGGFLRPVSFLKIDKIPDGKQVLSKVISEQILNMLHSVLELGGTGTRANIQGYQVAGKTGTAHIARPHGYYSDRYWSSFVGIAPVSNPELVVVVVVKNPRGLYYGGSVAGPAFANIMHGALRVLNIPPDAEQNVDVLKQEASAKK